MKILGIGTVTAAGAGISSLELAAKESRIPELSSESIKLPDKEILLHIYRASSAELERFIAKRALRRFDSLAKLALLAANLALEDAAFAPQDASRIGIIFCSGYGPLEPTFDFLDSIIDFGDAAPSPTSFAKSVHNAVASQISMTLKFFGPCQTITAFEQSFGGGLLAAKHWLESGIVDYVLLGAGEEYHPVRGYAASLRGAGESEYVEPFDFKRCSYLPGEGCAFFLLSKNENEQSKYNASIKTITLQKASVSADSEYEHIKALDGLIIGANGNTQSARYYEGISKVDIPLAGYAPLFGSMPTGNAFDLALCTLALKERMLFSSPNLESVMTSNIIKNHLTLPEYATLGCIQFSEEGYETFITLSD